MKPVVVILAAGASARLGTCKALVDLAGRSALERLLASARAGGADECLVVVGAHRDAILPMLARVDPGASPVDNPRWAAGRTGSLAVAVARLPGRDLLVAPIDVPLVGAEVFRALLDAWRVAGAPARGWLAPALAPGGRHGHPVVLGRELSAELPGRPPDEPLKLLRGRADPAWGIPVFDPAILDDLDTPEELARMRARLGTD